MPSHDSVVWFAKTFGLFYLIGLSIVALIYSYWPSKQAEFDAASSSILSDEDKPWRN